MIILYTGILLIIYSLFSRKKYKPAIGFLFVWLIMAFQSNVEGDYEGYMNTFNMGEVSRTAEDEPLWDIVAAPFHFLGKSGWYLYVICLATFQYHVTSRLVKRYAYGEYAFLGAILFFFTFGMMLIQMKAMRQGLAIEMSLLPFLFNLERKKRKWIWCSLPMVCAFFVHNSAIVSILPIGLYYLNSSTGILEKKYAKVRGERFLPIVLTVIYYVVYALKISLFSGFFMQLSQLITMNEMRLGNYLESDQAEGIFNVSWLIIFYDAVIVYFSTWYFRLASGTCRVLTVMSVIGCFCDMLFFGMGSLPRIGYFFTIANIVVMANISNQIRHQFGRIIAWMFIIFCIGYAVKTSLPWMTGMDPDQFGHYKFIFMN